MRKASAATIAETATLADVEYHERDGEPGSPKSGNTHSRRTSMTLAHTGDDGSDGKKKGNQAAGVADDRRSQHSKEGDEEDKGERVALEDEDESDKDMGPFRKELTPLTLAKLVDPKSLHSLRDLGGAEFVLEGLGSNAKHGLSFLSGGEGGDASRASHEERQRVYGANVLPVRKSKTLLQLMWAALKDKVLVLLSIAAFVSLALGLFQDFGTPRETFSCGNGQTCTEPPVDWVEGVAIMVAIVIVVVVGSLNDWQKEKQFRALNEKKEDRTVKVMRDGAEKVINVKVCFHIFCPSLKLTVPSLL